MDNAHSDSASNHVPKQPGPASREIIEMLAAAPRALDFKPSKEARERVWELIAREREGVITPHEQSELDHYGQLEHIMRLVKAQARKRSLGTP